MFSHSAMRSPGNLNSCEELMTLPCQEAVPVTSANLPCHTNQGTLLLLHVTWTTSGDSHWLRQTCKPKHFCFLSVSVAQAKLTAPRVELEMRLEVILLTYCWDHITHSAGDNRWISGLHILGGVSRHLVSLFGNYTLC